ncbi:MAG: indole-3-glycerol-phosphate synthase [Candidatus Bathyarchaeia archaeon]
MSDYLAAFSLGAWKTVESGYYECEVGAVSAKRFRPRRAISLKEGVIHTLKCGKNPIIAEIKVASPSGRPLRENVDALSVASAMKNGGAAGVSVITEPKWFKGSLNTLQILQRRISIPLLMKDFIVSRVQVDAAYRAGADAVLLIEAIFDNGYSDAGLREMIDYAHSLGLEVLLEAHTEDEFRNAVSSKADLIGINNRDLRTLNVDLHVAERLLRKYPTPNRLTVAESGISSPSHVRRLKAFGAKAFLVGSAVMSARSVEEKVRSLVEA